MKITDSEISNQRFCKMCGGSINSASKKCDSCGKQYFKFLRKKTLIISLSAVLLVIVVLLGLNLFFYFDKNNADGKSTLSVEDTSENLSLPFSEDVNAINRAASSVVKLECYDITGNIIASGSGFVVYDSNTIVTNLHVIMDAYSITAITENNGLIEIDKVLTYDEDKDIAFLFSDGVEGLTPLEMGNSDNIQKGDRVVAIGSPLGLKNVVSTGIVSNLSSESGSPIIQFTAAVSSGSSGGALFNDKGEVIGVTQASYIKGQNLNLAVPVNIVNQIYDNGNSLKELTIKELYNRFKPYGNTSSNLLGNGVLVEDTEHIAYLYNGHIIVKKKITALQRHININANCLNIYHNRLYFFDIEKNDIGSCKLDGTDIIYMNLVSDKKVEIIEDFIRFENYVDEMLVAKNKLIFIITKRLTDAPYFFSSLFVLNLDTYDVEYKKDDVTNFVYWQNELYFFNDSNQQITSLNFVSLEETNYTAPGNLYIQGITSDGMIYFSDQTSSNNETTFYSFDILTQSFEYVLTLKTHYAVPTVHLFVINNNIIIAEWCKVSNEFGFKIYEFVDGVKQRELFNADLEFSNYGVVEGRNNLLFNDIHGDWYILDCNSWQIWRGIIWLFLAE